MHAPSTKRGPAGRRPRIDARPVRACLVALAVIVAAGLLGGGAAGAGTGGSTPPGGGDPGAGNPASPYRGDGMWIWYVSRSSGGDLGRIAHKAKHHGVETVYVKSSDGSSSWSQFTPSLVKTLHSRGLRVCAWQFVYGTHPFAEAKRGAEAVGKGADCLVIDAESSYEGHYGAADTYVDKLRHLIGRRFPTALASFPYVDYHPGFPYSVFLGPGGARYNLPQLYWHTIGVSVAAGYLHTWTFNRVYQRQIYPLGQTYANPPTKQIRRFRRFAISYGFHGVSWWDWQETTLPEWRALGHRVSGIASVQRPANSFPVLRRGSRGDLVIWAQEHLKGAGESVRVTGVYGRQTVLAVKKFQASRKLKADGAIGAQTWRRLLQVKPQMVHWSRKRAQARGKVSSSAPAEPRSASLPAVRDEIPPPAKR